MIDTAVLLLNHQQFTITNPTRFEPNASRGMQAQQNPTKKELASGIYKPRLTLFYRTNKFGRRELFLKIELSLPKLMFGNNFMELQYKDFGPLMDKLAACLRDMGVEVTTGALAAAPVSAIHYAKNFILTDGATPYHYITKINQLNAPLSLDVNKTDYRNEGHSFKWHCNSYEVVFYDKILDLEQARKSAKRALEKEYLHHELLGAIKKRRTKFEVLRMEVRLNKRAKMKQILGKLGIRADLTLKKLFKPAISKKVLLHYLAELERTQPLIATSGMQDKQALASMFLHNTHLSAKAVLHAFGLQQALKLSSPRELRMMMAGYTKNSWQRIMADAQKITLPGKQSALKPLREQLEKFKAVRTIKL